MEDLEAVYPRNFEVLEAHNTWCLAEAERCLAEAERVAFAADALEEIRDLPEESRGRLQRFSCRAEAPGSTTGRTTAEPGPRSYAQIPIPRGAAARSRPGSVSGPRSEALVPASSHHTGDKTCLAGLLLPRRAGNNVQLTPLSSRSFTTPWSIIALQSPFQITSSALLCTNSRTGV